jgi:chromosome segregation ATPase
MRIKKFYEAQEQILLSNETLNEMIDKIKEVSDSFDKNKKILNSLGETLSNFETNSKNSNSQLDDASLNLKTIQSKISDLMSLLDSTNNQLKDYYESGEKFIYGL